MEADFSGYATRAGLKCSDGRIIMPDAFKHQDNMQVPLVWQHGHPDPLNVLGHAILENRDDGVYAHAFFNNTEKAQHMKEAVAHKDIRHMSIWANELIQRGERVLHGVIREVSLVLSGANPGAVIESVTIRHADGDDMVLEDEAIIYTGLELEHSDDNSLENAQVEEVVEKTEEVVSHADKDDSEETIEDVYNSMTEKQKNVLHYMLGQALEADNDTEKEEIKQSNINSEEEGSDEMTRNVFEQTQAPATTLSHSDIQSIVADATKIGSLKDAVENYALSHGIDDIDVLFPEARALDSMPEWDKRRTEWVAGVLNSCRKSPFSRIKTLSADITEAEARAKGYITGSLKKEEFFSVAKRVTTPTTVYKKQKLDRDDMLDITDFDVVMWLKGEMRLMLDEELARAVLIGDGRDIASEDKINEQNIRPVAKDHQAYVTTINVNIDDANSSIQEIIDAIVLNRKYYKGTGLPVMYTTESYIAQFMLLKDGVGRRIYKDLTELASELRVAAVVPVEVMEEETDLVAILVNLNDYVIGADRGGQVSMFDDFDIDYNQHKYLIETRVCGALAKLKSALVVRKVASTATPAVPTAPTFDGSAITIIDTTGVIYKDAADDSVVNAAGSPYAVASGEAAEIYAVPDTGYYFETTANTRWVFRNRG